jgi:outer membrane protein assembly factor BamB
MFHGNPQHTGQGYGNWSCYPAFRPQEAIKWSFATPNSVFFSPVIDKDNLVYFVSNMPGYALVFALEGDTGQELWIVDNLLLEFRHQWTLAQWFFVPRIWR